MVERMSPEEEKRLADALKMIRDTCLGPGATVQETIAFCIWSTAAEVQFYQVAEAERERLNNPVVH